MQNPPFNEVEQQGLLLLQQQPIPLHALLHSSADTYTTTYRTNVDIAVIAVE